MAHNISIIKKTKKILPLPLPPPSSSRDKYPLLHVNLFYKKLLIARRPLHWKIAKLFNFSLSETKKRNKKIRPHKRQIACFRIKAGGYSIYVKKCSRRFYDWDTRGVVARARAQRRNAVYYLRHLPAA